MIQSPQSFVLSTECSKAAEQNGFRRRLGESDGWAAFQSTTAHGTIWIAATDPAGPWFVALDHPGVIRELNLAPVELDGPGLSRFGFDTLRALYLIMPRIYQLAASLPDAPLRVFQDKVKNLSKTTDAERLVVQRIGQGVFREGLLDYWQGKCPLTGITDKALLRASHIIPWSDCSSDAERLDVHNGLLLSALWDAAFDRGLVTFEGDGSPKFSPSLSETARAELRWQAGLSLTDEHKARLQWHRHNLFCAE